MTERLLTVEEATALRETALAEWKAVEVTSEETALLKGKLGSVLAKSEAALRFAQDPSRLVTSQRAKLAIECRFSRLLLGEEGRHGRIVGHFAEHTTECEHCAHFGLS